MWAFADICIYVTRMLLQIMHMQTYACVYIHMHAYTHICRGMHVHAFADICIHMYPCAYIRKHMHTNACICMHMHMHANAFTPWGRRRRMARSLFSIWVTPPHLFFFGGRGALHLAPDAYIHIYTCIYIHINI